MPDPEQQFVVEVDTSDVGVGAVLSQRSAIDQKLHPCAFFSRWLTPAERNYDIGNRELLAVKLALEEWRHRLEGTKLPFLVWTDHKNLEYIQSAKRLNSRQARWSLFLTRFNFSLSYRPGSRHVKPDALSRQFQEEEREVGEPDTILPYSRLITTSSGIFISVTPINPPEPVISPDHGLHPPGHPIEQNHRMMSPTLTMGTTITPSLTRMTHSLQSGMRGWRWTSRTNINWEYWVQATPVTAQACQSRR